MNRRSFLTSAGVAGGALAIPTLFTPNADAAISIDTSSLYAAAAFHGSAIGNQFRNTPNINDWKNIASATQNVVNMWKRYNLDVVLRPGFNTVTESMISASHVNCAQISKNLAPYYPMSAQQVATEIQNMLNACNLYHPGMISSALNTIRTTGMTTYLQGAVNQANVVVANWSLMPSGLSVINPLIVEPHPTEKCAYSAMGLLFAAVGLTVISIMSEGLDLIVASGWGALSFWGGIGTTGWAALHAFICK